MVKRSAQCKFPVARIKKIMQADEDVGKVAQATPVLICKSCPLSPPVSYFFLRMMEKSSVTDTNFWLLSMWWWW